MKFFSKIGAALSLSVALLAVTPAVGLAQINVQVNVPQLSPLLQNYSKLFGYTPAQLEPVKAVPEMELPTLLQIAKKAAVVPAVIYELRKSGISYMDILSRYALSPSILIQPKVSYERLDPTLVPAHQYYQQYGSAPWPKNVVLNDPVLLQLGQVRFLTDYVRIAPAQLVKLPTNPVHFSQLVLAPRVASEYIVLQPQQVILPPGQAKKVGLWVPPGQAKKMGLWAPPGQAKKMGYGYEKHGHGGGHGHGKGK